MIIKISDGSIYIKKNISSLIWFQLYYMLFFSFFRDIVGLPGAISYVLDLINIILFLYIVIDKSLFMIPKGQYRFLFFWILFFIVSTLAGVIITGRLNVLLYIWGFRNTFRYYFFFISCVLLLDISDISEITAFLKRIYVINFIACVAEFIMGYKGDYLGGIFGITQGCNGYLNLFLVVLAAIYITEYLENKVGLFKMLVFLGSSMFLMAISELKVFIFEIPVIILIALFNAKFSFRKIILIIASIIGVIGGVYMLGSFFEDFGASFFTFDNILGYMGDKGYTSSGDLSRFNAVFELHDRFLSISHKYELFGIGLGNASYSNTFTFLNSSFYQVYQDLHYQWFTDSFIYIETGIIGLIFLEGFFVVIYIFSIIEAKRLDGINSSQYENLKEIKLLVQISGIVAIMCIINSIYNSSLSMDSAYLAYFILAIPVVVNLKVRHQS